MSRCKVHTRLISIGTTVQGRDRDRSKLRSYLEIGLCLCCVVLSCMCVLFPGSVARGVQAYTIHTEGIRVIV